jgi:hypothetical protein
MPHLHRSQAGRAETLFHESHKGLQGLERSRNVWDHRDLRHHWLALSSSHVAGFPGVQSCCNIHRVKFLEQQLGCVWNVHL